MIDPQAGGVITTDRYGAYNWLTARRRQICWAHLARDFQALVERGGESQEIGEALLRQVEKFFHLWHKAREVAIAREWLTALMKSVRRKAKRLLQAGAQCGHKKTRRTCANVLKVEPSLWTFLRVEDVEPTNKAAERALRRAVLWRRKSFGTQSAHGSRFVGRVLTVVTTLSQQGRDVLEYLTQVCRGALAGEVLAGLTPDLSHQTT